MNLKSHAHLQYEAPRPGAEVRGKVAGKWGICYTGLPIHPTFDGSVIRWRNLWRPLALKDGCFNVDGWVFPYAYGCVYFRERQLWEREYIPPSGVDGKIVLDVGAGAGETAKFFLDRGADEVIAVEPNPEAVPLLRRNSENRPITVIDKPFDPSMLQLPHDFLKMDIEGYEMELITEGALNWYHKPCAIEAHGRLVVNKLSEAGFIGEEVSGDRDVIGFLVKIMHRWI
jgi:SAM-dependent methyltransferase